MPTSRTKPKYKLTPQDTAYVLKGIRKNLRLTQEAVADVMGISQGTLSKMERAKAEPSAIQWLVFCRYVGVPSDILFQPEVKVASLQPRYGKSRSRKATL